MLSFFPLDVLDEIWDVIESVSEGFLTNSCTLGGRLANVFNVAKCHSLRVTRYLSHKQIFRPRGYKTIHAEHDFFPAHKC